MFSKWCALILLLSGTQAFLIHNMHRSLCLDEMVGTYEVVLKKCNLVSDSQQWAWVDRSRLVNLGSSRCLSAHRIQPIRTEPCPEQEEVGKSNWMDWDCDRDKLISRNTSMLLSLQGRNLVLSNDNKNVKWRSLDQGDICQDKLRSRRASEEFEVVEKPTMTAEEREYLRWFYRTEDSIYWKYSLLALSFVCLLVGFMLLGMGAMANKNRKKIAKYKAAAVMLQKRDCEELRVITLEDTVAPPTKPVTAPCLPPNGELSEGRAGNIVLTYKDGNTSSLYPDEDDDDDDAAAVGDELTEDREMEGAEDKEDIANIEPEEVLESS